MVKDYRCRGSGFDFILSMIGVIEGVLIEWDSDILV